MSEQLNCPLCARAHPIWWEDDWSYVIYVQENQFPILRVVAQNHVKDMTDLSLWSREKIMRTVFGCERILKVFFQTDKINLASLGNQVPHLHWHVIARFSDDSHFPNSIWAEKLRSWNGVDDSALQSFFMHNFLKMKES